MLTLYVCILCVYVCVCEFMPSLTPPSPSTEPRMSTVQPFAPANRVGVALTGAYIARPRDSTLSTSTVNTPAAAKTLPASASSPAPPTQTVSSTPLVLSSSAPADPARTHTQSPPLPIAPPAAAEAVECVALPPGRMLFAHTAEGEGEISVAAGAIVGLLDTSREDWWNIVVGDQVRHSVCE